MGRVFRQSNPTEINSSWAPVGDDTAWVYTRQEYDYQGRPTVTTNEADNSTRILSYNSCGCAGGDTITSTDEVGRKQKTYQDFLGRTLKTEVLKADNTVYSTIKNTYNLRDQITNITQYQGTDSSATFQDTVMTYDGHARLSTRKAPIETNPTTYIYYADDQVEKRTDGRGADQTFLYNARHLVTSITHHKPPGSAPEGVESILVHFGTNVTFTYDAAGNRFSMNESIGGTNTASTTYAYNTISQLQSETRNIIGVGSFLLSYTYNLSGQLKTLGDPFGGLVTYAYNKVGELTDVTGSGFHGITQFASNFQYRAWGATKHVNYGNGMEENWGYDTRLRVVSYSGVGGVSSFEKQTYQYYPDSRLQRVLRPNASNFERSYSYDHAARLTTALTGNAARGQAEDMFNPDPYKQNFAYDAFNNMTSRSNDFWNIDETPFSAIYVNDRNQDPDWEYDAAGNINQDSDGFAVMTYNTASQLIEWENGPNSIEQSYDGDGQPAKRIEVRGSSSFTSTIYYLRSSVLDGAVIADLNSSGQPVGAGQYRNIYANGGVLARERYDPNSQSYRMNWQHYVPVTGDRRETTQEGFVSTGYSSDPLGGLVGQESPYLTDSTPTYEEMVGERPFHVEDANPIAPGGRCTWNGMPANCSYVLGILRGGSAVVAPNDRVMPVRYNGEQTLAVWQSFADGYSGYVPINARYNGNGGFSPLSRNAPSLRGLRNTDFQQLNGVNLDNEPEAQLARSIRFVSFQQRSDLNPKYDKPQKMPSGPSPKQPCDPSNFNQQKAAFNQIAADLGGTYRETHEGYSDSESRIINTPLSAEEVLGKFAELTYPDPHWDHWGGDDRKIQIQGEWYHLTVFFNYTFKTIRSGNVRGERWDMKTALKDYDRPPTYISIHCEPEEPGSLLHTFRFLMRKIGGQ